jgi:arabinose-5-phosphate isomerase
MNRSPRIAPERALDLARRALQIESEALERACASLGTGFVDATILLLACRGRVIVTGMGKSGHVGRKIAATLASTGTPAHFMHPAEASHGDLGMITPRDVVIALSNSGESDELNVILPVIKRLGVPLVAITGQMESTLARMADAVLSSAVAQEACPLNLTPTASTTVQMALGDALAVSLLDARGFQPEDFARSHPGGSLGRRLLVHVRDLMRTGDALPRVDSRTPFTEMLREMTGKGLGFVAAVEDGRATGIFTDGDLRRLIERGEGDLRSLTAGVVMHPRPRMVRPDDLAAEAALVMEQHRITSVLVVDDDGQLVGALNTNDLLRAKVI